MKEGLDRNKQISFKEEKHLARSSKLPYHRVAFERGSGALLWDYEGKEYIDFLSSASSANIGHGNEEIAEAVAAQMKRIAQYTGGYFYNKEAAAFAQELIALYPGDFQKKISFGNSGSDSIDGAIKMARGFTGRSKIISLAMSYFGSTYGAMSLSAISLNMRKYVGPHLPEVYHYYFPVCYRCKYDKEAKSCGIKCIREIEDAFELYLPREEVAAIFVEAVAGDAGIIVPPVQYMQALRALCDKNGILLVVDETQQALGRTGKWFSFEHFGIIPDMVILGKSLGGGLPAGAVLGRADVLDYLEAPAHLFTMSGNATVMTAGLKMLEIIKRENLLNRSEVLGGYLKEELLKLQKKYDIIGDVRGLGLSLGVDLVTDRISKNKNKEAAAKICHYCITNGLIIIFFAQSTLRIQPPLVITKEQIDKAVGILDAAFSAYQDKRIETDSTELAIGW